jgi:hypothetical protein
MDFIGKGLRSFQKKNLSMKSQLLEPYIAGDEKKDAFPPKSFVLVFVVYAFKRKRTLKLL